MKIKFYGTRGSIPTSGSAGKYGGNTTCLDVQTATEDEYIFDAGSGIRELGNEMMARGYAPNQKGKAKIFLTHIHWDHIQGLPFFVPAYIPTNEITVHGEAKVNKQIKDLLANQMTDPYFPVPMELQKGLKNFKDLEPGRVVENGIAIGYWNGNHPNGSLVYALREGDKKVIFATDYEHDGQILGKKFGPIDQELVRFARGAKGDGPDVLIMDAQYTPEEYIPQENAWQRISELNHSSDFSELEFKAKVGKMMGEFPGSKIGWGHSTYEKAVDIGVESLARELILTHHDPNHSDEQLDEILERAEGYLQENYPDVSMKITMAYDGLEMEL